MHLLGFCRTNVALGAAAPPIPQCDAGAFKVVDRLSAWIKKCCRPHALRKDRRLMHSSLRFDNRNLQKIGGNYRFARPTLILRFK